MIRPLSPSRQHEYNGQPDTALIATANAQQYYPDGSLSAPLPEPYRFIDKDEVYPLNLKAWAACYLPRCVSPFRRETSNNPDL
jgi:hypothetical protein